MKFSHAGKWLMQCLCGIPLLFVLAACGSGGDGGGGGGGGTPPAAAPLGGTFVDSPVQGLGYSTTPSGLSGLTDANGRYNYNPGDLVTFSLFGRAIGGAVPAAPVVTPLSVFNVTGITDPGVMNLSQLLLTLAGGAPAPGNSIVLPATAPANFPATLDFSALDFDTSFPGLTLVSAAAATTHLQANFSTLSVTLAGSGNGSVTSNPTGLNCGATCSVDFYKDAAVTLTATGAGFTGWSGACTGTGSCVVMLNANTSVTATFTVVPGNANLTVTKAGNGAGTVTSSPAGLDCGAACSAQLVQGTVILTANAANGSTFAGWSAGTGNATCTGTNTCGIPLTVDSTVTATFTLNAVPVSVTANIASGNGGGGTVTCSADGGGAGPCGSYLPGTAIVMAATPNSVSNFTGWSGAGCSGTGTCNFILTANTTVTANFNRPTLTVVVNGTGSVSSNPTGINTCTTNCSAPFDKGAVTLTASGTGFTGWSGGGCSGTGFCTVTMNADQNVTATFTAAVGAPTISSVSPNPVPGLDGQQTVTLTGTGFVAGATVRLVDVTHNIPFDPFDPGRTTVVSATQIQIQPNLTATAATWSVQVRTPSGQVSNVVTFTVTRGFRLLVFPLPNRTHLTVSINSVFDHSMTTTYCPDDRVVAYTGEEGRSTFGSDLVGNITGCGNLSGFRNALGTLFNVKGQYIGGGLPQFLYYDGHPGYDYRTVDQCPGGTITADCPTGVRGQIRVRAAAAGTVKAFNSSDLDFGRIKIDHGSGYETWYMHLSRMDVFAGQSVSAGQFIGVSGDIGASGSPHLHFEVRKDQIPVDPYGWEGAGSDPYLRAVNITLW